MSDQQSDQQREMRFSDKKVVKANQLVRSKTDLTKLEQQVLTALIAEVKKDDDHFRVISIRIRDILQRSSSSSEDFYSRGKEICQRLLEQKIQVQSKDGEGNRSYDGVNVFSRCSYKEGRGEIEARFTPDMEPFLLGLEKRFTMYLLHHMLRLSSRYSMRIYELMKMREWVYVLDISVEEFREILSLENKYDSFSHLRKYVIDPSREEINEKTDIEFTYKVLRDGQIPVRLKFFIEEEEKSRRRSIDPGENTGEERPDLQVRDVFFSGLTQEEVQQVEDAGQLEEEAIRRAKDRNPGAVWSVIAAEAAGIMERLWRTRQSSSNS